MRLNNRLHHALRQIFLEVSEGCQVAVDQGLQKAKHLFDRRHAGHGLSQLCLGPLPSDRQELQQALHESWQLLRREVVAECGAQPARRMQTFYRPQQQPWSGRQKAHHQRVVSLLQAKYCNSRCPALVLNHNVKEVVRGPPRTRLHRRCQCLVGLLTAFAIEKRAHCRILPRPLAAEGLPQRLQGVALTDRSCHFGGYQRLQRECR
mmetsp:Transcript_120601/g.213315  ORF Transcript_120601/g.213315 Transcript_120601/m.213315 type:complete len:206 (+) Transcript_120601:214-831(+)